METLELLKELGMDAAAVNLEAKIELNRKLHIAYQNYKFVSQEKVDKFNEDLRKKTESVFDKSTGKVQKKIDPRKYQQVVYDKLLFQSIKEYRHVPPPSVLEEVKKAAGMNCFDTFEVAKIESVKEIVDPIIFGKVNGCTDLFFIAQWDSDVKFEYIAGK